MLDSLGHTTEEDGYWKKEKGDPAVQSPCIYRGQLDSMDVRVKNRLRHSPELVNLAGCLPSYSSLQCLCRAFSVGLGRSHTPP